MSRSSRPTRSRIERIISNRVQAGTCHGRKNEVQERLNKRDSPPGCTPLPERDHARTIASGIDIPHWVGCAMTMKQPRPRPDCRFLFLALALLVCLPLALTTQASAAIENQTGEQIYQQQCLSCHGKHGEGSKEYGHPLAGDRSVGPACQVHRQDDARRRPGDVRGRGRGEGRGVHLRRVLFQDGPGAEQAGADRAVAAHGPAVPQRGGRPDRQLPRPDRLGRAQGAARRILQVAAVPEARTTGSSTGSTPMSSSTSA